MTDNLVIEDLRAIRATQDQHSEKLDLLIQRVGTLESQYANLSVRVDRIDARLDRVERRLDLQGDPVR